MRAALKDKATDVAHSPAIGETEIRALLDHVATAIRAKDVDALMAHYAPDVLTFDLLSPLQYTGADAIRKRASQWFSSFQGPIGYEMRNLSVTAGHDVAFCHGLNGSSGTNKDGAKVDMWWRATNCLRKIDGKWLITHAHSSEPFDMKTGKALLDLKP
jgi:uncharacterized protein (TIGR02246 family)